MKIPEIVPVSDLRKRAAEVLEKLQESEDPVVVTQRGRAIAVIQDIRSYENAQKERALLEGYLRGMKDIAEGKTRPLDEVMREALDLLDKEADQDRTDPAG